MARNRSTHSSDRGGGGGTRVRLEADRMQHPKELSRQLTNRRMGKKKGKK